MLIKSLILRPQVRTPVPLGDNPEIQLPVDKKGDDYSGDSLASGSSGFGSLPRPNLLSGLLKYFKIILFISLLVFT